MGYRIKWRQAFVISCLVHLILLGGLGFLTGRLVKMPETENYLEMELISQTAAAGQSQNANPIVAAKGEPASLDKVLAEDMLMVSSQNVATTTMTAVTAGDNAVGEKVVVAGGTASANTTPTGKVQAHRPRNISPPQILKKTEPLYPEQARRDGAQGTVVVKMEILENGLPAGAWVQHSSGYTVLDEAALAAVQTWRFVPARDNDSGQAIHCYTSLSVVFRLN